MNAMFKYFQKLDSDGKTSPVAINVTKVLSASPAQNPKATVLVFDNGNTAVIEGTQLDIVTQLNN